MREDQRLGSRWVRQRHARLLSLTIAAGSVGGFLLGSAAGGLQYRLVESVIGGVAFLWAAARAAASATIVAAAARAVLVCASVAGGFGVGYGGGSAGDLRGAAQLSAWVGAVPTEAGLAVLVAAIAIAIVKRPRE